MEKLTDDYVSNWSKALKGNSGLHEAACSLSLSILVLSSTSHKRPESTCEDYHGTAPVAEIVWDSGVACTTWDRQAVPTAVGFLNYWIPNWPNYIVTL